MPEITFKARSSSKKIVKRALPMFSESLKGVVTQKFPGGFAPRPPHLHRSLKYLDPPLLSGSIDCKQETARCSSVTGLFHNIEMIGDGLTITWSFRSCQCVECDLAIHSLIWRIQNENRKLSVLSYIILIAVWPNSKGG